MLWLVVVDRFLLARTLVITKVIEIEEIQWFLRVLVKSIAFKGTRSSGHHEVTASDYWTVGSTPEIDFSKAFEKV